MQNKIQHSYHDKSFQTNLSEKRYSVRYNRFDGYLCETAGTIGGAEDLTAQLVITNTPNIGAFNILDHTQIHNFKRIEY